MKAKRESSEIAAGSMADIAFLLLIFFLVTTSIVNDKGLLVKLPAWDNNETTHKIPSSRLMNIMVNANNQVMVNDATVENHELIANVALEFLQQFEASNSAKKPVVSLQHDRETSYTTYIAVYDQLKRAYRLRRDEVANQLYDMPMDRLSDQQQMQVRELVPLNISEAEPFVASAD